MGLSIYFDEKNADAVVEKVSFESELWEKYRGAGGNVKEAVMALMNSEEDFEDRREGIFEELSHQMSFYEATWIVLPYLVELLDRKEKENDFMNQMNLIMEMGICLGTYVSWINNEKADETAMEFYNRAKEILREKTKRFLNTYEMEISECDEDRKSMFITALPAVFGNPEFTFLMTMNYWEECSLLCSECEYLEEGVEIEDDELKIKEAGDVSAGWDKKNFTDTYEWYSSILSELDESYLEKLKLYFGTYTCPECGAEGLVVSFMKNYYKLG